jgi:pyruvate/2-oxoglutarate dehydrogenase complex dihydrolipoamide acyltransferase (E2) component
MIYEELTLQASVEIEVVMPKMGESITEGTVIAWYRNIGDEVEVDETLFEIGTDKVDTEVPSPAAGVLTEKLVQEGETVEVDTVVARLKTKQENLSSEGGRFMDEMDNSELKDFKGSPRELEQENDDSSSGDLASSRSGANSLLQGVTREVSQALEQGNLQFIEGALQEKVPDMESPEVKLALREKAEELDEGKKDMLVHQASEDALPKVAEVLLEHGADANAAGEDGWAPLHRAALNGNPAVAEVLLKGGAAVNVRIPDGLHAEWAPLHIAGNPEVAEVLLEHGADVDAREEDGQTPLHWAALNDNPEVAKVLIESGADVNAVGGPLVEQTPLDMCDDGSDVARLLHRHGGKSGGFE